jgi:threonine dehydratase
MSWSVSAVGKSSAVEVKLSRDIADCCRHLVEPEKTVAEAASAAISAALKAFIPDGAVKVSAFGSQSKYAAKDGPDVVTSSLMIEIEPINGFVE